MSAAAHKIAEMENENAETGETPIVQEEADPTAEDFSGELNKPLWSVITFEKCAEKNLSYDEAAQKLHELQKQDVAGLCIVTDETAERMKVGC